MSTTIYIFLAKIRKIMYTPVNPSSTIQNWGLRGSKLYRNVFVMSRLSLPTAQEHKYPKIF